MHVDQTSTRNLIEDFNRSITEAQGNNLLNQNGEGEEYSGEMRNVVMQAEMVVSQR